MKRIKKLASLLLAMIMVLTMAMTAFAEEDDPAGDAGNATKYEITINYDVAGYQYAAYQIFKGDLLIEGNEKTLSNIDWGSGVDVSKVNAMLIAQDLTKPVLNEEGVQEKNEDGSNKVRPYTAREVAEEILDGKAKDAEAAQNFAANIADCLSNTYKTSEEVKNSAGNVTKYTISDLDAGYYLVQNIVVPADGAYTRYMLEVVGNVPVSPKTGVPTSEKKIVEGEQLVDVNEASIGDEVNYQITGTLPENFASYKEYYYVFTDNLGVGLTYMEGTIKVKVVNGTEEKDVTEFFYQNNPTYDAAKGTAIIVGIQDLKSINLQDGYEGLVSATSKIVVTYTATLNEYAFIATPNLNDVVLDYSNDPNHSGDGTTEPPVEPGEPNPTHPTGVTPKDEVETYTTELAILKTDENGDILTGAEFTLTGTGVRVSLVTAENFVEDANGDYWKLNDGTYTKEAPVMEDDDENGIKNNREDYDLEAGKFTLVRTVQMATEQDGKKIAAFVDENGRVVFTGLGAGTYTISETETPAGYNTIEDITFTVSFDATNKVFSADNVGLRSDNTLETTIINKRGSLLPSTGGIGTTIFYVVGGILVIGAGILLVAKKRMSANK